MSQLQEEWRPVVGYEGRYDVSNLGRVRSIQFAKKARATPLIMTPGTGKKKIDLRLNLCDGQNYKMHAVHLLVLTAFRGPRPNGREGSHIDGNRANNRYDNLIWESHIENEARKIGHGTKQLGERVGTAKLTADKVREIRTLLAARLPKQRIAAKFGVTDFAIYSISIGRTWSHLQ